MESFLNHQGKNNTRFDGNEVCVVDYKSGNVDNAKDKLKAPESKNPKGGDYWRQAVFYKILVDNYKRKNWTAASVEFDFVEPNSQNEYVKRKLVIGAADITTVMHQIEDVWKKIQEKDFNTGCGKATCQWCNFVKDNFLYSKLMDGDSQEEAD